MAHEGMAEREPLRKRPQSSRADECDRQMVGTGVPILTMSLPDSVQGLSGRNARKTCSVLH